MELFLSLVILTEVGILVREAVEVLDEVIEDSLLAITSMEEFEEFGLQLGLALAGLLSLEADVAEDTAHLALVILR